MRIHEMAHERELRHEDESTTGTTALSGKALELFSLMDALFGLEAVPEEAADREPSPQPAAVLLDLEG